MAHEDLPAGRLVNGFDAFGPGNGAPGGNEAHGMAVAGIIAATHNNLGIAGLAPNVQVMPVRIFDEIGDGTDDNGLVNACAHAVNNGAEVINNSWGIFFQDGSSVTDPNHIPALTNCITDAMENGRNGDGIVVIFASGNNGQEVTYPANVPGVISVGAVDDSDEVFNYSSRGNELDIVAPSGEVGSRVSVQCGFFDDRWQNTLQGTVWSLDQDGPNGWNPGDTDIDPPDCFNEYQWSTHSGQPTPGQAYTAHFGGTSAAAPQISGAAALMLTVNPDLTLDQVRDILHNTADWSGHMGGSPPTDEYGHGRLNANEAVKEAMPNQYAGHSFTSSTTLPDLSRISGFTNLSSGVTLTIASGNVAVIEGSVSGSNSTLAVNGRLIIDTSASLNNVHIDVGSGGELIIRKDAALAFAGGQGIEANGIVTMEGTNSNRITLQRTGGSNWDGVELHADNSSLRYVDIHNAVNGVTSYNLSGLVIQNVEVFNSTWDGFRFINTSTASPAGGFGYLRAEANGTYGVYYDGGSNDGLTTSIMKDNPSAGLFITGGASLEGVVNSRIYDGGTNGIRADNSSFLEITSCSIHDNAYREAFAFSNSTIDATGNWWGQHPPSASQFEEVSGSTIDYSNALFFDPLPGSFQKIADGSLEQAAESSSGEDTRQTIPESIETLADLRKAVMRYSVTDALAELDRISGDLGPEISRWAQIIRIELYQRQGSHEQALQTGNVLLAGGSTSSAVRNTAARRMFYSYLLGTQDVETAASMVGLLGQWDEEEAELNQLNRLLNRHGKQADTPAQQQITETGTAGQVLVTNYPNPFNPSTEITYQLPVNSTVSLKVYDMLGRKVAVLVDGERKIAGEHSVSFDAGALSSGIYLYRLQTGSHILSRQMTLIK